MGRRRPSSTRIAALGVAAVLGCGLLPATAAHADDPSVAVLSNGWLNVTVSTQYPQVLSYQDSQDSALTLDGAQRPLTDMVLNGTTFQPTVTATVEDDASAIDYHMTFADFAGVEIDARIGVDAGVVTFAVTDVEAPVGALSTIEIPHHSLVSVDSSDKVPQLAAAVVDDDRARSGDTFMDVTRSISANPTPVQVAYAIVNANGLAAALETNAMNYDGSAGENARIQLQSVADGDEMRVELSSAPWLYYADGSSTTQELPWAKVAVTKDANNDQVVDWEDGAIAMRSIAIQPRDGDKTPNRVIAHIPFNFASQATHPFLRTLDDVKRIALATDGLGQLTLLKGYQSEGHDSAHPDYAGNYNERAGGLEDLNVLLDKGADWNSSFSVHINTTEAYAEANAFSDDLVTSEEGWDWLGASYKIDQARDLNSGDFEKRIADLAKETKGNLTTLYVDVYYAHGWRSEELQRIANKYGFALTTEWADKMEHSSLWSHWASDEGYGGEENKGINSQIIRFVRNHQKDVWNPHPLLGNAQIAEFEGWTGQTNWNDFYSNIWTKNLPAKYLQQAPIISWHPQRIELSNGVVVTGPDADAGVTERLITADGKTVLKDGTYLLPWYDTTAPGTAPRMYHYNPNGGTTTWELTGQFASAPSVSVYQLGIEGRTLVGSVAVKQGTVELDAKPGVAYVVYPDAAPTPALPAWGEGSVVHDPGFSQGDLAPWSPQGNVIRAISPDGHAMADLGSGEASVSQQLGELPAGTYAASAWVQIAPGYTRPTTISVSGDGVTASETSITATTAENWVSADEKHTLDTEHRYFQRLRTVFTVTADAATPLLRIAAGPGDADVLVDDVRVVTTPQPAADAVVAEDFEDVDQGWGPFVKGNAGGVTDPRTHLAAKHAPFTQQGWRGKAIDDVISGQRSLKSHIENEGLVYRTWQGTAPFVPGHEYKVEFAYQSGTGGIYSWQVGYDALSAGTVRSVVRESTPIAQQLQTKDAKPFTSTFVAGCGDAWVGLYSNGGNGDFVMDDLRITDLGEADDAAACGNVTLSPASGVVKQGEPNTMSTTVQLDEGGEVSDVAVSLEVPDGWSATPTSPATAETLAGNGTLTTAWNVVPAVDSDGAYQLGAKATYSTGDGAQRTLTAEVQVNTFPKAPTKDTYASDMTWISETNGWGPAERDMSNGEDGQGDGGPLVINAVTYDKGLGTHAPASLRFFVGGQCTAFTAEVGIDDFQTAKGTARFEVVADGKSVIKTDTLGHLDEPFALNADITGAQYVDLVVDQVEDNGNDHADWGNAMFRCSAPAPSDLTVSHALTPAASTEAEGWVASTATLTLSAGGDGAADATVEYSLDGGTAWLPYTQALTFADSGTTTVHYRATSGEQVATGAVDVKVDKTAPVTTVDVTPASRQGTPSAPVTVQLAPRDAHSGVQATYINDGSAGFQPVDPAQELVFDKLGTYTLAVRSADKAGNMEAETTTTITISANPQLGVELVANPAAPNGANGWYTTAPTATISATNVPDGATAVLAAQVGEGAWGTVDGPIQVPQGTTVVGYRASVGDVIASGTATFKVDTENPTAHVTASATTGTPASPVVVTAGGTDAGSGLAAVEFSRDGGTAWQPWAGDLTLSEIGTHTIAVRATDNAGLVSEQATATVTISGDPVPGPDQVSLVATLDPATPDGAAGWYRTHPFAVLQATGTAVVPEYQLGDGPWAPYTGPVALEGQGEVTLAGRVCDQTCVGADPVSVRIDSVAPAATAALQQQPGAQRVDVSATDATSGVAAVSYRINSGAWVDVAGATAQVTVSAPGLNTVSYRATDAAGNVAAIQQLRVPVEPPQPGEPTAVLSQGELTPGGQVTVTGSGFLPGEEVIVTLHSETIELGRVRADAKGEVTFTFTVPQVAAGHHTVTLTGAQSAVTASAPLEVTGGGSPTGSATTSPSAGATASATGKVAQSGTGAGQVGLVALGLLALGGGVVVMAYRRRRATC